MSETTIQQIVANIRKRSLLEDDGMSDEEATQAITDYIMEQKIEELERINKANKGNGISFWFEDIVANNGWRTMKEYIPERIAELRDKLKV